VNRILYTGTRNASSWSMRAWLAMREAGLKFEEREVDIRRPQRHGNLATVGMFSPPAAVPVLVEDGTVIFDSLAIMEYAHEAGGCRLLPLERQQRARARSFLAWVHSGMSGICANVSFESSFDPDRRRLDDGEAVEADRLFAVLEQELVESDGPYLFGALSLADLAFVPVVRRLLTHGADLKRWPCTRAWTARLMARDSVREWMREAEELPPVLVEA
jgi:glutathione S-transferase